MSQVLFAIGATIRTDLNGVLRIAALWDGISGNLGLDRMYQGPSVTNAAKVTQVIVTEHQYIKSGESSTLFEGSVEEGKIVTFDDPVFGLSASGFTILESGANYAKLSSGSGKLAGTKYTHNKSQIIRNIVSAKEPNVKKVENATLVSLTNSAAVADRMKNYYKHAQSIQAPVVYKGESTGNRVLTWDPYNKEPVTACIEKEDITKSVNLTSGDGLKTVHIKVRDDVGNESAAVSDDITLNTTVPVVTVTGPDKSKISKVEGYNKSKISFTVDVAFAEYKVCVVPANSSTQDAGVLIPTDGGSINTSGADGDYPASTPIEVTITGTDLETASSGDNVKIVKVFVKTEAGIWSVA